VRWLDRLACSTKAFHLRCWKEHALIAAAIRPGGANTAARLAHDHCEVAGIKTWQRLHSISEQSAS
jgi:hypothetical protein